LKTWKLGVEIKEERENKRKEEEENIVDAKPKVHWLHATPKDGGIQDDSNVVLEAGIWLPKCAPRDPHADVCTHQPYFFTDIYVN
jgi:hypothetical protein